VTAAFALGLLRRVRASNRSQPFVSVVVAARNEEDFIAACLESLSNQTYPTDCYEIIVVDDDSTDRTREIVEEFEQVHCLKPSPEYAAFAAKKRPMATGVSHASGELILTTDADCTVPETWIETIVSHFEPAVSVVTGYSRMAPVASGLVHRFQAFDFFTLLAAAAGSAGLGRAWAATGQNLAYRRNLYDRIGGFSRISTRPSGDDVLLLQLFRQAGARISFCLDQGGHVTTWRSESLRGLINQRKRWASNAVVQLRLNPFFFAYITSVFVVNLLPVLALVLKGPLITLCLTIWCLRACVDASVVWLAARRLGTSPPLTFFPIWLLLQIPYVLIVGIGSLFGFDWKNRNHVAKRTLPIPLGKSNSRVS
jgi:cellulose synthase/poly-beta-1,6-N-acetylglucosamine synthase-like glycosyltransferase